MPLEVSAASLELQPWLRRDDWQQIFSPNMTSEIRLVVQQFIDCPFVGTTKRLYLQGKVFELILPYMLIST
ncbi:hypothetical protein ACQ4M4_23035 [Leptolyngbya sp. AN02str]|uniref:hypothetical protein n=1 Tax=Leptolyngbya sp. AN02str TaxID=3423363 RepID=UPI003D323B5F